MSKKKNKRRFLKETARLPQLSTHHIDASVARQLPIIFGFKHLNLDKSPFKCSSGHGSKLLYILKTFRLFSEIVRMRLEISYPKCHSVPEEQISKFNLHALVALASSKKLHQLGRERTPERIIGYFDSPALNLFQVCFLDLNHKLSGS